MIDTTKQYTYNGKPVRIYADGSDTYDGYIHIAYLHHNCNNWVSTAVKEADLVEVWQPKEGEWCWFKKKGQKTPELNKFSKDLYDYFSTLIEGLEPFIGTLPSWIKDN